MMSLSNDYEGVKDTNLRSVCSTIPSDVLYDLGKIFGIFDDIDMSKHFQMRKVSYNCRDLHDKRGISFDDHHKSI